MCVPGSEGQLKNTKNLQKMQMSGRLYEEQGLPRLDAKCLQTAYSKKEAFTITERPSITESSFKDYAGRFMVEWRSLLVEKK